MKELVILSGKGGTGKTSVTASFAALAKNAVFADADVDAADLHLVLNPAIQSRHEFRSGHEAIIRQADCCRCGACLAHCRFEAVKMDGKEAGEATFTIDPIACEGCGVCVEFCPSKAIDFPERVCGEWFVSDTRFGPLVHARLRPAGENSGKLVTQVRTEARRLAERDGREMIVVDGPPGIGCPVIASVTGASAVLAVTEPTVSGEHDLDRVLKLARHFGVPAFVCVNKWDINSAMAGQIEQQATAAGATIVARIPYDRAVTAAQVNGLPVVEFSTGPAAQSIHQLWEDIWKSPV
jgi:MinD superfamily P-loop ATPase